MGGRVGRYHPEPTPPRRRRDHQPTAPRPHRLPPARPPSLGQLPACGTNPRRGLHPGKRGPRHSPRRRDLHVPHGQMARRLGTNHPSPPPKIQPNQHPTPTRRLTPTRCGPARVFQPFRVRPNASLPLSGFPAPGCLHREGDGSGPPGSEFVLPQPRAGRAPAAGTDPRVGTADTRRPPHRRSATADRPNMGDQPRGRPGPGPLPAARGPAATGPGRPRNRDLTTRSVVPRFVVACRTPDL